MLRPGVLAILCLLPCFAYADDAYADDMAEHQSIRMILSPQADVAAGQTLPVLAKLQYADGHPVLPSDLREMHTQKFHLLVIDPSLSDYHHIHPTPTNVPGEYAFSFSPVVSGAYRMWADLTPEATGKQVYVSTDMGVVPDHSVIDKTETLSSDASGLHGELTLEHKLHAHEATMVSVSITKQGKPFRQLEPVMGAYAHAVGFSEDYHSILHVHPMGDEPTLEKNRGGPELTFHIEPKSAGFVRLFVQLRVNGQDVFLPFGLTVLPSQNGTGT